MAFHIQARWCLIVLAACASSFVHATVELIHQSTVYLPYNITNGVPLYNLSSDAVEQLSYDPQEKIIYACGNGVIHVVDGSDPSKLTRLYSQFTNGLDFTDIEACGDYVFVSADNVDNKLEGYLLVYKKHKRQSTAQISLISKTIVGPSPDMIYPRSNCLSVLIALEGQAFTDNDNKFIDPEGGVGIVSWATSPEKDQAVVKTLDFKRFNTRVKEILATGARQVYTENGTFSTDCEPEFIALDVVNNTAFVCLQETNAIAVVNLTSEEITSIHGLGYKQMDVFDASDRDKGIQLSYFPVRAWYTPDGIQFYRWENRGLLFTANEGGKKKYDHFREYQRGKYFKDLGSKIPAIMKSYLRDDTQLGRLKFSRIDGQDENGTQQALYTYGGRGFSVWDTNDNFRRLYDSGSDFEKYTALFCPHAFNTEGDEVDEKSDSKGPETETVAVAQIGDRLYAFLGNENPGTIFVYSFGKDVTKPRFEHIFCGCFPDNGKTLQEKFTDREVCALDPEEIKYVNEKDSPTGSPILIVSGAVSGTVSILKIKVVDGPSFQSIPAGK